MNIIRGLNVTAKNRKMTTPNTTQNGYKLKVVPRNNGDRQYIVYNSEQNQVVMITTQKAIADLYKK